VWELEHPRELAYWFGHHACRSTVVGGAEDMTLHPVPRGTRAG
jgi:hypothetical protein